METANEINAELSQLCQQYVGRIEELLDQPAYNLIVNLSPGAGEQDFWFIEIFPRTNRAAGFEIGTDIWINPVPPETAARRLRGKESAPKVKQ